MFSPTHLIRQLPYFRDSVQLFAALADQPWAVFLDSGFPYSQMGRYDIIAADPVCTLVTRGEFTTVTSRDGEYVSEVDPFQLLKEKVTLGLPKLPRLPFNGGAIGYFAYDLVRRLEELPVLAEDAEHIPEMAVGIYEWALLVDHRKQCSYLIGLRDSEHVQAQWQKLTALFSVPRQTDLSPGFKVLGDVQTNMTAVDYSVAFAKIKHYLKEGDCYQVNLAQRFAAPCTGDPWAAYMALRKINAAPFGCYLNVPGVQVLSSSPERFLQVTGSLVVTKPIKGTRPRKDEPDEDRRQIEALSSSEKDRAENVMIVDLLRNDIGKNCRKGSVRVPKLFDVESYATVHHLVSTVSGELDDGQHAVDLLRSCFPGGSITGAPKIRAMEVIEELEPHRRGVYCGAIGYIGFDGNMDTNIAIRTLVHSEHCIRFWAGGGIVNDSVLEEEYQESFDKAAAMLQLLRQLRNVGH
ncbi:MAG: aminodeoxychorismate synthase component I [Gammaproteobacteria bacterium]